MQFSKQKQIFKNHFYSHAKKLHNRPRVSMRHNHEDVPTSQSAVTNARASQRSLQINYANLAQYLHNIIHSFSIHSSIHPFARCSARCFPLVFFLLHAPPASTRFMNQDLRCSHHPSRQSGSTYNYTNRAHSAVNSSTMCYDPPQPQYTNSRFGYGKWREEKKKKKQHNRNQDPKVVRGWNITSPSLQSSQPVPTPYTNRQSDRQWTPPEPTTSVRRSVRAWHGAISTKRHLQSGMAAVTKSR